MTNLDAFCQPSDKLCTLNPLFHFKHHFSVSAAASEKQSLPLFQRNTNTQKRQWQISPFKSDLLGVIMLKLTEQPGSGIKAALFARYQIKGSKLTTEKKNVYIF